MNHQVGVMYLTAVFILVVVSLTLSAELLFKLYDRAVGNEKAVMFVKLGIAMWLILALSLAIWLIIVTWEIWESRGRGRLYWVVAVTAKWAEGLGGDAPPAYGSGRGSMWFKAAVYST